MKQSVSETPTQSENIKEKYRISCILANDKRVVPIQKKKKWDQKNAPKYYMKNKMK